MIAISIVLITLNEERNLARCLASVAGVGDEIIIADSFSVDSTVSIAKEFGARVISNTFNGYGQQKNFATSQASHNWILSLDADEELTEELRAEILYLKKTGQLFNAYKFPRLTNYCGKWIRHCGWYPDYQTRLYDRTKGNWKEEQVHEYWQPDKHTEEIGKLRSHLLHYSFSSVSAHLKKIERYTELAARAAVEKGRTASLFKIWISPKWHFFSEYFFKRGFMDGFYGYVICKLSAYSAFLKYTRIRLYSKATKQGQ